MKRPKTKSSSALLQSLKIINTILSDDGRPNETHVMLHDNWAVAHNGVLGVGEKILEDLYACPNAYVLEAALAKCGESLSITQLEQKLSIKSDKFRALIPCMPVENMPRSFPDAPCARVNDRLKAAFETVASLPDDQQTPVTASVLIRGGSVFATDRKIILESFHGIDTPVLTIPKSFVKIAKGAKREFKQFGFSNSSFTIYFDDGCWMKTQQWVNEWPDVLSILNTSSNPLPIPEDFWEALDTIQDFSTDGWAYTRNNKIYSHPDDEMGASHDCYGIPPNLVFSIVQMQSIKKWVSKIDFFAVGPNNLNCIKAFGETTRCVIAGRK